MTAHLALDLIDEKRAEAILNYCEEHLEFEIWQLAAYLEDARQSEPFDPSLYDDADEDEEIDPEFVEVARQEKLRRRAADLLLVEQARGWLLNEDD